MAQANVDRSGVPPDVRLWEPETRRKASLIVLGLAGVLLLASLVFYGVAPAASGTFLWVAIVALVLLLVAEAAILATGIAREDDVGPAWLGATQTAPAGSASTQQRAATAGTPPPGAQPEELDSIDLKCPECQEQFTAEDTGERPLETECPHCGAKGNVELGPPEQEPARESSPYGSVADEPETPPEDVETLSLKCPACDTQFEVDDDGTRPLTATCPGCGRGGKLKG